ncbi:UNKNOWN [Stylonychia lemnae]|uniref:Morn repeat protein n=1 Tax=Stylonychia lemnae TaxID=5949 RepID=A0A077ZR68_STYLE|nr:UNKNOWN [Stylonychia lemnae]|eukprot:CDW71949.1 UNKNOWN [Stylonychia lemnae]
MAQGIQRLLNRKLQESKTINMKGESGKTKSHDIDYKKCKLSSTAFRQTNALRNHQEYSDPQPQATIQYNQSQNKASRQSSRQQSPYIIRQSLSIKKSQSSVKLPSSEPNRVVSMCFQNKESPFLNMISSAEVRSKDLVQNPVKLSDALLTDQHRQMIHDRVTVKNQNTNFQKDTNFFFQDKTSSRFNETKRKKMDNKAFRKKQIGLSKKLKIQDFLQHNLGSLKVHKRGDTFDQNKFHQIQQLKKSFSSSNLSKSSSQRQFAVYKTSKQQIVQTSAPSSELQTCLVWNKESQNMVLQSNNSKDTLSSLYIRERKKIQLQSMVDKPNVLTKPKINDKTEKIIPSELRKVIEEIERDLQRYHQAYSDSMMTNNSQTNGSIRIQNTDIDQKLKGRMKNGMGIGFLESGDIYSGVWKEGKREGFGACKFFKGGYYKGEWLNDEMIGNGILVKIDGTVIGGKFLNNGRVTAGQKYQILYPNGEYYDGIINTQAKRHGKGAYFYKNGDYYEGDWVVDKRHGKGKLCMEDGSEFTGEFIDDRVEGDGVFVDAGHNRYENSKEGKGFFRNGRLQRKGKAFFQNGDVYNGYFKDGCFDGKGKMKYRHVPVPGYFEQEAEYKGEFKHGRKHGFGKMEWQDGSKFKGHWDKDQRMHGVMKLKKQNKKYEGHFKNDLFHGPGKMTFIQQKFVFEGDFLLGNCPTKGKLIYQETGDIYEGSINQQFQREGHGKIIYSDGDQYEGKFLEDMKHGQGLYKYSNGDFYQGEYQRDKKHGTGRFQEFKTKEIYEGQWRDDERNGEGVLYLSDGCEKKGTWKGLQIISKTVNEKPAPIKKGEKTLEDLFQWGKSSQKAREVKRLLVNDF